MNACGLRNLQQTNCQLARPSQQLQPLSNVLENPIVREIWLAEDSRKVSFNQLQVFRSIKHGTRDRFEKRFSLQIATKCDWRVELAEDDYRALKVSIDFAATDGPKKNHKIAMRSGDFRRNLQAARNIYHQEEPILLSSIYA